MSNQQSLFGDKEKAMQTTKLHIHVATKKKILDEPVINLNELGLSSVYKNFGEYIENLRNNKTP